MTLTEPGERLFTGLTRGLSEIDVAISAVQRTDTPDIVTLHSSSSFSYFWLIPRLSSLYELHPEVNFRYQTGNREPDLEADEIILGVRIGTGTWENCESHQIAEGVVYPVASPEVWADAQSIRSISDLAGMRLIEFVEPRPKTTWKEMFAYHDIANAEVTPAMSLFDYTLVLQATLQGGGVALGWRYLTAELEKQGALVARKDWTWKTGHGAYLVWSATRPLSHQARKVRDWIIDNSREPH